MSNQLERSHQCLEVYCKSKATASPNLSLLQYRTMLTKNVLKRPKTAIVPQVKTFCLLLSSPLCTSRLTSNTNVNELRVDYKGIFFMELMKWKGMLDEPIQGYKKDKKRGLLHNRKKWINSNFNFQTSNFDLRPLCSPLR